MAKIENQQNLYCDTPYPQRQSVEFSLLAEEINQKSGVVVGVFWDDAYKGQEVPAGLNIKHFFNTWGTYPNVTVIPLDSNQIRSYSLIEKAKIDILIFPYGEIFPMDAFGLYSSLSFQHFIKKGGAILTTGGIPFMKQASNHGDIMPIQTAEEKISVYDRWVSKFGVKYYPCPILPQVQKFNLDFLPSLENITVFPAKYGIVVNNSSHNPVPKPPNGNVFPERYPVRQIIPLSWGTDSYGKTIATTGILTQDYEDGSARIHFSYEEKDHPLSPENPCFADTMAELFRLLTNKVYAGELETEFACYRQKEKVAIRSQIINFALEEKEVTLQLIITAANEVVYQEEKTILLPTGNTILSWNYAPESFASDEYFLLLNVIDHGNIVSRAENGFVVWTEEVLSHAKKLTIQNEYFQISGTDGDNRGAFITGTNYYESTRGEIMWFRPDVKNIIRDIRQMAECGVNMIRPHYHHLKWFKEYLEYHHGTLFPFYEELKGVTSYMPDERRWRIWDLFIYLCQKYEIIYNGDLFTLVPSEMGDPRGWFGTVEAVLDNNHRAAQKEFLEAIENRYKNLSLIAWDLFNEPYMVSDYDVEKWAADLKITIKDENPNRLICVGGPFSLGEELDFDCPHGRIDEAHINTKKKPLLLQELHIDRPEPLEYEILQGEDLRRIVVSSIHSGVAGICPWSWTRQMRLWQDTYEHHNTFPMEKWDDRLGMHTHDDATLKIAGQIFKDIAIFMRSISVSSYDASQRICKTDRGCLCGTLGSETYKNNTLYHYNGEKCYAAMDMSNIQWNGKTLVCSDTEKYLFFFIERIENGDFATASRIYFKTEDIALCKIYRTGLKEIHLVDFVPKEKKTLALIPFTQNDTFITLSPNAEMTRYWFEFIF